MPNFFWGHSGENRKIHIISQDKTAWPKKFGGFSIRKVVHQNKIYMRSLSWKLSTSPQNVWSKIITNKYGSDLKKKCCLRSYTYKNLQEIQPLFQVCTKSIIGKGNKTNLWDDCQLDKPIRHSISGVLLSSDESRTIDAIIKTNIIGYH